MNTALHAHPRDIPNRPLETAAGRAFPCSGAPLRGFEAKKKGKERAENLQDEGESHDVTENKGSDQNRRESPTISMKIKGLLILSHDLNEKNVISDLA
jgi:hypothetical protein